jgi:hypothetical protein
MSKGYTADGRRISSMTHATRGHDCGMCPARPFGNGGVVSHGRAHVRRGEAIELVKHYEHPGMTPGRVFLAPTDPQVAFFLDRGFEKVED